MSDQRPTGDTVNPWREGQEFANELYGFLRFLPGIIGTGLGIFSALASPRLNRITQTANKDFPFLLPDVSAAIQAFFRGKLQPDELREVLARNGVHQSWDNLFIALEQLLPTISELRDLHNRGLVGEDDARRIIQSQGMTEQHAEWMLELATRLPQVSDVIPWLVREVLDPDKRKELQLDDDFPEASLPYFKRLGFDDEYARNTWAAHWRLPSTEQSYRLYHRELISLEDLRGIMTANDILPKYREALIRAAYNPLTRVDVRRMHALGVLDDDGVLKAYKDIGYDDANAKNLLEFTKRYNSKNEEGPSKARTRELSTGQLKALFLRDAIDDDEYTRDMQALGYGADDIALMVGLLDKEKANQRARDQADTIVNEYVAGELSREQATGALDGLGLSGAQAYTYARRLGTEKTPRTRTLTLAELNRMLRQLIIDGDEYIDRLQSIGYTRDSATMLLQSYGPAGYEGHLRVPTVKQLEKLYQDGMIDDDKLLEGLLELGFGPEWSKILFDQIQSTVEAEEPTE